MSTPAATSVESVREKRAIVTLRTTSPIFIGSRSFSRSHRRRPASVLRNRLIPKTLAIEPGRRMNQVALMKFDAASTAFVSVGRSPPSCAKMFTKTGTRKSSIPTRTRVAKISTIVG
jgi:hypothetical protein